MRRLAVMLLCGCAHGSVQRAEAPTSCGDATEVTVSYAGHALESGTFVEGTYLTRWRVVNPLHSSATVSQWSYALKIGGRTVTGDAPDAVVTVPARSCQDLELRQKLDFTALFGDELPANGSFEVSVSPSIDGKPTTPITKTGTFPLPRPPQLTLGRLHVTKGAESFGVELEVLVHNGNDFPVKIERYEGEVLIAGNRFGRIRGGELTIAPRSAETVPVKTSASVLNLNGLAKAALSSTEAISTDVTTKLTIAGRPYSRSVGGMVYPR